MLIYKALLRSANGREFDKDFPNIRLYNDGTGTLARGNYVIELLDKNGKVYRRGFVKDFPRRSKGPWELLRLALNDVNMRYGHDEGEVPFMPISMG